MNILIDFDGTILNASYRMFSLFAFLVPESTLTIGEYWELKRRKMSHSTILRSLFNWNDEAVVRFDSSWHSLIEDSNWLSSDYVSADTYSHLMYLESVASLYLVTARQNRAMLLSQLESLGVQTLFTDVFVTERRFTKYELVRHLPLTDEDWFVGDTGHDVLVGKQLKIKTAAVSDGFLADYVLRDYCPDIVCDSFCAFDPFRLCAKAS